MLILSPRLTKEDLACWQLAYESDLALARSTRLKELEDRALEAMADFLSRGPAYVGVSWGKDSVTLAHLAYRLEASMTVAWFPAGPIENPECVLVRDAFLSRFKLDNYKEIEAAPTEDITLAFGGHDGAQAEFERVSKSLGTRYISGVRAAESGVRKLRMMRFGESSPNTCAPIGWWPTEYVFAYLAKYDLPTHPAYAMTMNGTYERSMVRVGTLGGYRGTGHGRRELERFYYARELKRLGLWNLK